MTRPRVTRLRALAPQAVAVVLAASLAACEGFVPAGGGTVRGGWSWPTAAPLPPGATAVVLDTERIPDNVRPDAEYGACPLAMIGTFRIEPTGDPARPIRYDFGDTGEEMPVVWPFGFSARITDALEIVAPDGRVIAREGQPVEGLGGGLFPGPDGSAAAHVCIAEYGPQRVVQPGS